MWSYYAAGHTGCVIEFEIDEDPEVFEVIYVKGLQNLTKNLTKEASASDILSFKTDHWEHEKEYRIITKNDFYSVSGKITGVYLGIRVLDIHKELLVRSASNGIPIFETKIQQNVVEIRPNERVN